MCLHRLDLRRECLPTENLHGTSHWGSCFTNWMWLIPKETPWCSIYHLVCTHLDIEGKDKYVQQHTVNRELKTVSSVSKSTMFLQHCSGYLASSGSLSWLNVSIDLELGFLPLWHLYIIFPWHHYIGLLCWLSTFKISSYFTEWNLFQRAGSVK